MEPQTREFPALETRQSIPQSDDAKPPPAEEQLSASAPVLRFPRPQGSQHLANWVSNSAPDIRQPPGMSDTSSLADSAYEIVHGADSESQDDRLTESTCSLSASRPDDVHSLDGSMDHSNTDSDDDESAHSSHASSIRYADQTLQSPSTQLPLVNSPEHGSAEWSDVGERSIELQETDGDRPGLLDGISAKHVVEEYSADRSSDIAQELGLRDSSRRLVAAIRQTMAHSYLSNRVPLRVLYVGRAEAHWSILHKICSALWASPKNGSHDQNGVNSQAERVYNIVPISSFGPNPELDLMEASPCQIKVEYCTSAEEVAGEAGSPADNAAYCITTEQGRSYRSSPSPNGPVVQPKWDLPHIAVFFSGREDDAKDRRTRDAACSFMKRHGVPSIFVVDHPDLGEHAQLGEYIDEHTVHLSLESRDPETPMAPRRFPIDAVTFSNIDDRQLNRNLAYLTGLTELADEDLKRDASQTERSSGKPGSAFTVCHPRRDILRWAWNSISAIPTAMLLMTSLLLLACAGWRQSEPLIHRFYSSSSTGVCSSPPLYPEGFTTSKSSSVITSTTTVVINHTSTKTIQITQVETSTGALASATSLAGLVLDIPSVVSDVAGTKKPVNSHKTVCSVQVYSPTELLVVIPGRNKAVWLAHGAIDIAVRRSDDTIKTKISSVDEGVLVELDAKDAHGQLNVSVITTRKPKVNETFQVDLGKTVVTKLLEAGLRMLQSAFEKVPGRENATHIFEDARKLSDDFASALQQASNVVRGRMTEKVKRVTDNVRGHLTRRFESAETVGRQVDLSVLRAQIASKLWWLKVQGRMDEYAAYKHNASRLLKVKHDELVHSRQARKKGSATALRQTGGFPSGLYGQWRWKSCAKRDEGVKDSNSPDGAWSSSWRKLMGVV